MTAAWADLIHALPPHVRDAARARASAHYRAFELRHGRDKARRLVGKVLDRLSPPAETEAAMFAPLVALADLVRSKSTAPPPGAVEPPTAPSPRILDLPDIRQPNTWSCGAAASMAVGRYFGVGPDSLKEWVKALDTTIEHSTDPQSILDYLRYLGLQAEAKNGMTVEQLAEAVGAGCPVICPVQDYGRDVPKEALWHYGHYLVVICVLPGLVMVQDSSADNVLEGSESIAAPGKVLIKEETWLKEWHDLDKDGEELYRCGIVVAGKAAKGKSSFQEHEHPRVSEGHGEGGQFTSGGGGTPSSPKPPAAPKPPAPPKLPLVPMKPSGGEKPEHPKEPSGEKEPKKPDKKPHTHHRLEHARAQAMERHRERTLERLDDDVTQDVWDGGVRNIPMEHPERAFWANLVSSVKAPVNDSHEALAHAARAWRNVAAYAFSRMRELQNEGGPDAEVLVGPLRNTGRLALDAAGRIENHKPPTELPPKLEAKLRERYGAPSDKSKSLSDIPHYRLASDPARCCGTCGAFKDGRCRMFDAPVKAEMTCDEWVKEYNRS